MTKPAGRPPSKIESIQIIGDKILDGITKIKAKYPEYTNIERDIWTLINCPRLNGKTSPITKIPTTQHWTEISHSIHLKASSIILKKKK